MKLLSYSVGELQTNCYIVVNGDECIIIDPGDSAEFLLEEISRKNLKPQAIIATHGHFDHVLAVGELQAALQIPFYMSKEDEFLVKRLDQTAKHFLKHVPVTMPIQTITNLQEGTLTLSSIELYIVHTPGHTPGSVCIYLKSDDWLFTGDTLFKEGIGRYDFSYSDKKLLMKSLEKIKSYPPQTEIYPGHGETELLDNLSGS